MWQYSSETDTFFQVTNSLDQKVQDFIQRLLTWRGEQDFNYTNGIDYYNVLAGRTDIRTEINSIANSFIAYFSIKIVDYFIDKTNINVSLFLTFNDLSQITEITITYSNGVFNVNTN